MREGRCRRRNGSPEMLESLESRVMLSGNMPWKLPVREALAQPLGGGGASSWRYEAGREHSESGTRSGPWIEGRRGERGVDVSRSVPAPALTPSVSRTPQVTSLPTVAPPTPATATTLARDVGFAARSTVSAVPLAGKATEPLAGDANSDWSVNTFDLNVLSANWNAAQATWSQGDFNGDATVDVFDLNMLAANWGLTVTPPDPPAVYDWHTETINGVLNVWVPNPGDFGATYTVSEPEMLFGPDGIPNLEGLDQGPTGDCYFLAVIGATAHDRPAAIMNRVKPDATGGWEVTFQWRNASGVTAPVTFHTSRELSAALQTPANGEVWPLVMEKAYAAFRTFNGVTSTNTMASIAWGYAGDVMRYIGQPYTPVYTSGQSENWIYNQLSTARAGARPALFHTSATAPTMVASHVYVITGVSMEGGEKRVTTFNPWGFYETRTLTDLMRNSAGQIVVATA